MAAVNVPPAPARSGRRRRHRHAPRVLGALAAGAVLVGGIIAAHLASREELAAEETFEAPVDAPPRVMPADGSGDGMPTVRLSRAETLAAGIVSEPLAACASAPQVPVFGSVVDPLDLIQVRDSLREARGNVVAEPAAPGPALTPAVATSGEGGEPPAGEEADAGEEVFTSPPPPPTPPPDPTGRLARQTRAVRREIAVRRFGLLVTGWMESDAPELNEFIANRATLLRVAAPPGWDVPQPPPSATVRDLRGRPVRADLLSVVRTTDGRTVNYGFLLRVPNDLANPAFIPGASVYGSAPTGEPVAGVLVPASAVVWHAGKPAVYVQRPGDDADACFARREVSAAHAVPGGWFEAERTLRPGERVVVVGAQLILSEEGRLELRTVD